MKLEFKVEIDGVIETYSEYDLFNFGYEFNEYGGIILEVKNLDTGEILK